MGKIGIDLGTTNSAVAYMANEAKIIENQGHTSTPSVVAYDDGEILIGQSAKDLEMVLPSVSSAKRHMGTDKKFKLGDREYLPEDISAIILKELKRVANERLTEPVDGVTITIPAYFAVAAKEATKKAGEIAGFENITLVAEPIAAALAFGANEGIALVYDLGGGTFDVAIIDCFDKKMVGLAGDNYLGGDDFDNCLVARLAQEVKDKFGVDIESVLESRQLAKSVCEKAKITLSKREKTPIVFQTVIEGKPVNVRLTITRQEFEEMVMPMVDRTITLIEKAITKAKEKEETFSKEDIDTILLVGGSTYIPIVRKRVQEYFGKEPSTKVNPDLAVALGAAYNTSSTPPPSGHHIKINHFPPTVTPKLQCVIKGRTTAGSRIEVTGGANPVTVVAGSLGKFELTVELVPNAINEVVVASVSPDNKQCSCPAFTVRQDSAAKEEGETTPPPPPEQLTSRSLGLDVSGDDHRFGVLLPAQTAIPCYEVCRDYCVTPARPNVPGVCLIDIYEGEMPYAPLNTYLANLRLETPATPEMTEPLEITFQLSETDHLLTVMARMKNYPDREVKNEIKYQSASGNQLSVIDRANQLVNSHGDKLRPEDKSSISRDKQALEDLAEQYKRDPQKDRYEMIKQTGLKLKSDLERLEAMVN